MFGRNREFKYIIAVRENSIKNRERNKYNEIKEQRK